MPHPLNVLSGSLLVALVALASPTPTSAQARDTAHRLSELRARLHVYDVGPEGTTRVIAALGELAAEAPAREAEEARFLRAVATTDLSIIAARRGDEGLTERLALGYGVAPESLAATLRTDLEALRREPYLAVVEDALAALSPREGRAVPPARPEHTRQQAVFFTQVIEELVRAGDPTGLLAELASDPCARGGECPAPYDRFGAHGRRAVAGMTKLHALLRSIEQTAQLGDPFSAALAREVLVDSVVLRSISVTPADWATSVRPVAGLEGGAPLDADAVLVLGGGKVRAGWVPEVLWGVEGRPTPIADGPLLGSEDEVSVPIRATRESYVRPIPELGAHLWPVIRGASRVALLVEPDVEAHLVWRVLVSLEQAGSPPAVLGAAATDGTARGVAFETVEDDETPVGVFVRLGGFSAWQPGAEVSLPRQRSAAGWRFDFEALDLATRARARHPASLRFMGSVDTGVLVRAALRLSSSDRPLRVVVP